MRTFVNEFGLEMKFIPCQPVAEDDARVSGYASLFDVADQNGDIVAPGAFQASLDRHRKEGRSVKFLWHHDPISPIGVWDELVEDAKGLKARGRLVTEVSRAAEAAALLQAGAIDGLSIGYRTVRAEKAGAGRRLIEIDLWEVSIVTFPMLPAARASLKAPDPDEDLADALSEALQGARAALA